MKLPANAFIAPEKITDYLLAPQARGDKSEFLARAGYTLDHASQLLSDLRSQILPLDAFFLESRSFGHYFEIRGALRGPNGRALSVRTIWMTEHLSGLNKFITLLPDKRKAE